MLVCFLLLAIAACSPYVAYGDANGIKYFFTEGNVIVEANQTSSGEWKIINVHYLDHPIIHFQYGIQPLITVFTGRRYELWNFNECLAQYPAELKLIRSVYLGRPFIIAIGDGPAGLSWVTIDTRTFKVAMILI